MDISCFNLKWLEQKQINGSVYFGQIGVHRLPLGIEDRMYGPLLMGFFLSPVTPFIRASAKSREIMPGIESKQDYQNNFLSFHGKEIFDNWYFSVVKSINVQSYPLFYIK